MDGREKTKAAQRFPLAWQGAGGRSACCGNFGRGSLASSHAGTRLPIAAFSARTQGAPPLSAPGSPGCRSPLPQHVLSRQSSAAQRRKKTAGHSARGDRSDDTSCIGITRIRFGGSKRDASSQPCGSPVVFGPILHPPPGACQGRRRFFVKKSANPLAMTVRRE